MRGEERRCICVIGYGLAALRNVRAKSGGFSLAIRIEGLYVNFQRVGQILSVSTEARVSVFAGIERGAIEKIALILGSCRGGSRCVRPVHSSERQISGLGVGSQTGV